MKAEDLKNSILQLAMEGKLVPQDPNDEPASVLLERIREEKEKLIKEKKIKRNNKESFIFRKNGHFYEKIGKKGEPVCIDNEIPFKIPDSWECVRLGAFSEIARGGSPRPIKQYITEDSNGINWIKIGDTIKGDKYIYSTREKIKPEGIKKSRYVEEGDFLLTNSMSFGRPYILKTNGCIHDGWLVIKLNEDLFYQDFMFYLLSSNFIFEQFSKLSAGSAVKNLKIDSVKKVFVPIPPLNEQKLIVKKIEEILPFITEYSKYQEQLDKLDSEFPDRLKSSILHDAIQGKLVPQDYNDEPSSILLERIRDKKERLIKEKKIKRNKNESFIFKENNHYYEKIGNNEPICIDDEIPFEIPNSWIWSRLNSFTNIVMGQSPKGESVIESTNEGMEFHQGKIFFGDKFLEKSNKTTLKPSKISPPNSILLCVRAPVGKINLCDREICVGRGLASLKPYINESLNYLYYALLNYEKEFTKKSTGSTFKAITKTIVENELIPIPPLKEQERIVKKIEDILDLM